MAVAITAECTDDPGAPQVGLTITADGPVTIEVSWDNGRTYHLIRGGRRDIAGVEFVRDFTPPLNRPAIYRVAHDVTLDAASTTITVPSDSAWIQDPLNPRTAVALHADMDGDHVLLGLGSLSEATWAQVSDLVTVDQSPLPVGSIGKRMVAAGVPFHLFASISNEIGQLRELFMSSGQLVVRGLPSNLLDPVAHVAVGDVKEVQYSLGVGDDEQVEEWELTARQMAPIAMTVTVPWWTYDQVNALWSGRTYDEVRGARGGDTYVDWLRDLEP